jgi:hypothetical protein
VSDSEPLAALGATTCQDQAASLGCHACTKPVSPLAVQVAGLIRTLHDSGFRGKQFGFRIGSRLVSSGSETARKTRDWWVQKEGGKGTHGDLGCQADPSPEGRSRVDASGTDAARLQGPGEEAESCG